MRVVKSRKDGDSALCCIAMVLDQPYDVVNRAISARYPYIAIDSSRGHMVTLLSSWFWVRHFDTSLGDPEPVVPLGYDFEAAIVVRNHEYAAIAYDADNDYLALSTPDLAYNNVPLMEVGFEGITQVWLLDTPSDGGFKV